MSKNWKTKGLKGMEGAKDFKTNRYGEQPATGKKRTARTSGTTGEGKFEALKGKERGRKKGCFYKLARTQLKKRQT